MGTKFWLQSTGTPAISPSVHSNWVDGAASTNFTRLPCTATQGSTAMTNFTTTESGSLQERCQLQFISTEQLAAQTISGTFDVSIMQIVSVTGAVHFAYNVWVATDVGGVRGVLANGVTLGANTINSSVNYTQQWFGAVAISSLAVSDGDYLVVELGYDINNTSSKTMGCKAGDSSATDITADGSTTVANGNILFSGTISFYTPPSSTNTNQLMMTGCGT